MRPVALLVAITLALAPLPARALEIVMLGAPEGSVELEAIAPKIAEVIRPVAERHPFDIHTIRIEPSSGTAETLDRCGAETRTLCLGIVRAGLPIDLPAARRPLILRSDLDRACPVFVTVNGRFWNWKDLRDRAREARFVAGAGSDEEGLLRTLFATEPALAGVPLRLATPETRWPSDILSRIRREDGGVGLAYRHPDPREGLVPRAVEAGAEVFGLWSKPLAEAHPGFERARGLVVRKGGWGEDDAQIDTLCAPMLLVASDPARFAQPHWDETTQWHRRKDLRDMLAELDWALAADLRVGDPPDYLGAACAALAPHLRTGRSVGDALSDARDLLRSLGIRAVAHSSGQWIVTAGGAYVAGTIGFLGTTIAAVSAPWIAPVTGVITLAGYGAQAACTLAAD